MINRCVLILTALLLGTVEVPAQSIGETLDPEIEGVTSAVSGELTDVSFELRTVSIGSNVFHVPAGLGVINELQVGMEVKIYFKEQDGKHVVTQIENMDPA